MQGSLRGFFAIFRKRTMFSSGTIANHFGSSFVRVAIFQSATAMTTWKTVMPTLASSLV